MVTPLGHHLTPVLIIAPWLADGDDLEGDIRTIPWGSRELQVPTSMLLYRLCPEQGERRRLNPFDLVGSARQINCKIHGSN